MISQNKCNDYFLICKIIVSNYQYFSPAQITTPLIISNVNPGTYAAGVIRIRAISDAGIGGVISAGAVTVPLPGGPIAPTAVGTSTSNAYGRHTITFTAPSITSGSKILGYKFTTDNGNTLNFCEAGTTSPLTITGVFGTSIPIKILAYNSNGDFLSAIFFDEI